MATEGSEDERGGKADDEVVVYRADVINQQGIQERDLKCNSECMFCLFGLTVIIGLLQCIKRQKGDVRRSSLIQQSGVCILEVYCLGQNQALPFISCMT